LRCVLLSVSVSSLCLRVFVSVRAVFSLSVWAVYGLLSVCTCGLLSLCLCARLVRRGLLSLYLSSSLSLSLSLCVSAVCLYVWSPLSLYVLCAVSSLCLLCVSLRVSSTPCLRCVCLPSLLYGWSPLCSCCVRSPLWAHPFHHASPHMASHPSHPITHLLHRGGADGIERRTGSC
jgi:hypothetical protein